MLSAAQQPKPERIKKLNQQERGGIKYFRKSNNTELLQLDHIRKGIVIE